MKILMVSIFSNHFFNWVEQLRNSEHEIYWLDVMDLNTEIERLDFVKQTVGWRYKVQYPGRYWIKQNFRPLHNLINKVNERNYVKVFRKHIDQIQPDVVHSFEMYSGCAQILEVMKQYPEIKWIYSAWGNDYFYSKNDLVRRNIMSKVFGRVDYIFSDCKRDFHIAKELGFKGDYLGTFPGGGGFDLSYSPEIKEGDRSVILVKGYQNKFGRCNKIIEALEKIKYEISNFKIIVFAATQEVFDFSKNLYFPGGLEIKGKISRSEVLTLMKESFLYIGNSISDGMPNTLLEAIIMGAYPIQSNPGGATEEIIEDGKNGKLIHNPEDISEISAAVLFALNNPEIVKEAIEYNIEFLSPTLDRELIRKNVLGQYDHVEKNLSK